MLTMDGRNHTDLISAYIEAEKLIDMGKPKKMGIKPRQEIEDVFYEQFVANVAGEPIYSSDIMVQQDSL